MKQIMLGIISLILLITTMLSAQYAEREDVVWARNLDGATITLDGMLDEAVWAQAESIHVWYEMQNGGPIGLPTSASRAEHQPTAITDPTDATIKFLESNGYLYLGFDMPDSSVGGNENWARWDGILMSIKNHVDSTRPTTALEFFYTWWYANVSQYVVPGVPPRFIGTYGNWNDTTRTQAQRDVWNAGYVIHGGMSCDSLRDEGWTVEMKISLDSLGYDVTKPDGEVVELNFSIWDCDFLFENNPSIVSASRSWWQSPWGNANGDNVGRIHIRSDVTVNSGAVPVVDPDVIVKNGSPFAAPTIDGVLDDQVWAYADSFDIRWDDTALRASYPGVGAYRSGQYQPEIGGNPRPPVLDPADATIKYFFRDDYLYLAADVRDLLVQGNLNYDEWDGVRFMIGDRVQVDGDNRMLFQKLTVMFSDADTAMANEYLPGMVDSSNTEWGVTLKPNTTVNNHTDIDEGYYFELKVDLTYLGYPSGLGDHLLFMGVMLADDDEFDDPLNNYGTRTWWFREHEGGPACAWMVMDPNITVGIEDPVKSAAIPNKIELFGNYPNPFNPETEIKYSLPANGNVKIIVYDILGQEILKDNLGNQKAGTHSHTFNATSLSSGIYFYRFELETKNTSGSIISSAAKFILLK